MKIEGDLLNISMPKSDRVLEASKPEGKSASRTSSTSSANDAVDLGSQAGLIATALASGQGDRSSTVQHLRALVQSGQYQVDTAALSESIVSAAHNGN
jgi:anti-sigma28 factor (negative regulator of flagellin synthesis)